MRFITPDLPPRERKISKQLQEDTGMQVNKILLFIEANSKSQQFSFMTPLKYGTLTTSLFFHYVA